MTSWNEVAGAESAKPRLTLFQDLEVISRTILSSRTVITRWSKGGRAQYCSARDVLAGIILKHGTFGTGFAPCI
jgi:hypothetical protein